MTTETNIQFPQGPFVDLTTGLVTLEWFLWLQNPQFITVNLGEVLGVPSGGTGMASYTTGDIIYASASDELSALADIATGNALLSGGVGAAPAWGKIGLTTHVSGTLAIANGGTGNTTGTATINANLTGPIASVGNTTSVTAQTGTGSTFVMQTSPTLTTPDIGTPSAGTLTNCSGLPTSGITGGITTTITTAKLTGLGADGSMTFTDGVLTASTPAT